MIHSCSLSLNVVPLWRTANAEQIETTNSFHCLRFENAATENVDCAIVLCATQTRQFIQAPIFFSGLWFAAVGICSSWKNAQS